MNILFVDFIMHIDQNLVSLVQQYGFFVYPILFLIIFCETGLVITPFLPGDSLLFAAGAISAVGSLSIFLLFVIIFFAAVLGDTVNYWIGKHIGMKIVRKGYVKQNYIDKTQSFYDKYGAKTIILARFVPIIRTFAPFVAGVGKMNYSRFILYNVVGGFCWVALFVLGGFYFGNIPFVKEHFSVVILIIIFLSILPMIIEFLRYKLRKN